MPDTANINPSRHAYAHVKAGSLSDPDPEACALEMRDFVAGEQQDVPRCVSPILGMYALYLNSDIPNDLKQRLQQLIPSLLCTSDDALDERRGFMTMDWMIRTWLPAWLDLVPSCAEDARNLRELGQIMDLASARRARPVIRQANDTARVCDPTGGRHTDITILTTWNAAWAATVGQYVVWSAWTAADVTMAANTTQHAATAATTAGVSLIPTMQETQLSAIELFRGMVTPVADLAPIS